MSNAFYSKCVVFATTFGGSFFLALFSREHNYIFLALGTMTLIAGFSYLAKVAKKFA